MVGDLGDLLDATEREEMATTHEIDKAAGRSNQNVTPFTELVHLFSTWSAAIRHARTKHGAIAQTAGLIEYLGGELTGRSHDEDKWFGSNRIVKGPRTGQIWASSGQLLRLPHEL